MNADRFPQACFALQLAPGKKTPVSLHGHKDAVPIARFISVGCNVGIALEQSRFILADLDRDIPESREIAQRLALTPTWTQECPHGRHWIFRLPENFNAAQNNHKNGKFYTVGRETYGDIKTSGYLVGPGSRVVCDGSKHSNGVPCDRADYTQDGPLEVAECPEWLISYLEGWHAEKRSRGGGEAPGILPGSAGGGHDDFLFRLASWGRGQVGLNKDALVKLVEGAFPILLGQQKNWQYSRRDAERIAEQAYKFEAPAVYEDGVVPEGFSSALDCPLIGPPEEWIIRHFVPQAKLTMMYGKKGRGKSTFGGYVAYVTTVQRGKPFVFLGVEEDARTFYRRAVMAGAPRELLYDLRGGAGWMFPRDAKKLAAGLKSLGTGCLYIDAVMSHFDGADGLQVNERARKTLASLAGAAEETGWAIVAVFHENKAGEYLGGVEMVNVGRVVLHATRIEGRPLQIKVEYTNLSDPGYLMQFRKSNVVLEYEGQVQMDRLDSGELVPLEVAIPERIEDLAYAEEAVDDVIEGHNNTP